MNNKSISAIDLIILGFLFDRKMSAYELANLITEKQVGRFLKISAPAIYKKCKSLYEEGLLEGEEVKEGERSEKIIYSISKKGEERFFGLMEHFSSNFAPFFLDCNVFIWNIERIGKKQGLKMLNNLHNELAGLNQWIIQHEKEASNSVPFASRLIIKQYRMVIAALLSWSIEAIEDYKNK